jgi:hypothetical protein
MLPDFLVIPTKQIYNQPQNHLTRWFYFTNFITLQTFNLKDRQSFNMRGAREKII